MEVFVARQPIFDTQKKVFGYELLFRDGLQNSYHHMDGDQATSSVLSNSFLSIGIDNLTHRKFAFVNFTRKLLIEEYPKTFPKEVLAVELLEDVEPDEEIIRVCKKLKSAGYLIVLDDFVFNPKYLPLLKIVDIVKVDLRKTSVSESGSLIKQFGPNGLKFLAEKVETLEEFNRANEIGFTYFQGYFFSKPEIISVKDVPGYKLSYLQILKEIYNQDIDFGKIEAALKKDLSLSFKLLKFINSAAYGFKREIQSIRQALVLLGIREVKKWITLVGLNHVGQDKPEELMIRSIIRAKFCELLAEKINLKQRQFDLFLLGLFSMIDVFIERPMAEILEQLPISENIKNALSGKPNQFRDVYELMISHERGDWQRFGEYCNGLGIQETEIQFAYFKSLEYSNQIFWESITL
ncbi:HDOD domain-containing protein [Candidatus Saccharibacteria bacterium]|nr:HDOD domain-containing protein [Candidatus Saccharibacteria bacterium]NIW80264.1 HDOD domain-containing protein [Calditrichia bacterium]